VRCPCRRPATRTSATTHVPIAKYSARNRNTSSEVGTATTAQAAAAAGIAGNGFKPPCARKSTVYASTPTNACWPTEISPAYPASRFHMLASTRRMKRLISRLVTFA
jgi:hypothetical protein